MKNNKLRIGIIGCGNIFPMHVYPIFHDESYDLVALCDIKEDRLAKNTKLFNTMGYTNYKTMLAEANLDVVHVLTPHYLHPPMVIAALKAGCHVLTEKPMSIHYSDAKEMVATAKETGKTLGVIFQNRYNLASKLIKDTLLSGELGNIISGRVIVTWNRSDDYYTKSDWKGTWDMEGGGVIIDQAIHTLDLVRYFVNTPVVSVNANISNRAHTIIQVEDSAEGVIRFANDVTIGFYTINYYGYDAPVEIELVCEKGIVKMVSDQATINFKDGRTYIARPDPNETFDYGDVKSYWGVSHVKQIHDYYASLKENKQPIINGEVALETQKMICDIYNSGFKNNPSFKQSPTT